MKDKLPIIVPYRDRQEHLDVFVPHICMSFSRIKVLIILFFTQNKQMIDHLTMERYVMLLQKK